MRAAYLAWLAAAQAGELDDRDEEPPVPAGLGKLTAPLESLVDLLGVDASLVRAAAESADPLLDRRALERWLAARPQREKDRWLLSAIESTDGAVGSQVLAAFRKATAKLPKARRRTVAALLARAAEQR